MLIPGGSPGVLDTHPGDVIKRHLVAEREDGSRMEWHLIVQEDLSPQYEPRLVTANGEFILKPNWMPLPGSQLLFLQCPVYEALYEGTRGPGKTLLMLMDFARDVGKGHGKSWRGILFRREYKELDDIVKKIEEWFYDLFPGFRFLHSKAEYMAIWPTGETLLLRAGENEEVYKGFHGHEYPWIGFEELTQWEDDTLFLKMQSCCRSAKAGVPTRIRSSTNPYGPGHNWVKKRYGLPRERGKVIHLPGEMPRVAIHGSLEENFLLLHQQPHYRTQLRQSTKNPNEFKAWVYGSWDVTSGGMIDDLWNERIHIIPDIPVNLIPRGWTITRAYDHGQSHPFAVGWWLESNGELLELPDGTELGRRRGDLILWHEWYGTDGDINSGVKMPAKKIARGIIDREEDWGVLGRVQAGPADTEIYNRMSDRDGKCPADDMEEVGVTFERADKSPGSRKRGWELLRSLLEGAIPERDGTREEPGLFVCAGCTYWIDLCPPMPRDTKDPDEVPAKYEDHLADMTRYRISWELPVMWRRPGGF